MKNYFLCLGMSCFWRAFFLTLLFCCCHASGIEQTNSWTSPVSGNWEDLHWSLGMLPGTNQTILLTNAGWKALALWPGTAQNHPETFHVDAITVTSPTNSFNTLLLNFTGLQTPLVLGNTNVNVPGSLIINPGSALVMFSSALQVQNALNGGNPQGAFSIGGTFTESDSSRVTAGFLRLGDIGPAVYNLSNSTLAVDAEFVSGFPTTFNHQSGTNTATSLDLAGEYDLFTGFFGGVINFRGGTFKQMGGTVSAGLQFTFGSYLLAGGTLSSPGLALPIPPAAGFVRDGSVLQTGGTHFTGIISIGTLGPGSLGTGSYVLSNGVLYASGGVFMGPPGNFTQWGGFQTNAGINLQGTLDRFSVPQPSAYTLAGGLILTPSLNISVGTFTQSGGSNLVSGNVTLSSASGKANIYNLNGGRLADLNTTVDSSTDGGFFQSGGIHIVTNLLTLTRQITNFAGYVLSGGQLITQNIQVDGGTAFHHTGGTITHAGLLTLANGTWDEQTGGQQFGQLQLSVINATNSTLSLPTNIPCVLQFAASSSLTWSNQAALAIENWSGSLSGGGNQRLIFGNSASALSTQQLNQIRFHNPAGLSPGTYPARMLPTGEITPDLGLIFGRSGDQLVLQWNSGWILQTATNAPGPYLDLSGANSPFTNQFSDPLRFFRLRR
jgi:hypothetical protein